MRYETWAQRAKAAQVEAYAVYFALRDPRVPWFAKIGAVAAVGYIFSPIQLIPDWIPVIGCADDFVVLGIAVAYMRRFTPRSVLDACHERAEAAVARRRLSAPGRVVRIAAAVALTLWLIMGSLGIAVLVAIARGRH